VVASENRNSKDQAMKKVERELERKNEEIEELKTDLEYT
jgi:hypothetical protein